MVLSLAYSSYYNPDITGYRSIIPYIPETTRALFIAQVLLLLLLLIRLAFVDIDYVALPIFLFLEQKTNESNPPLLQDH